MTAPNFAGIPRALRDHDQWLLWRKEKITPARPRGTKVPYRISDPTQWGSSTNPETWGSLAEAERIFPFFNMDGVGFCFTENLGMVIVDIDHCITLDGDSEQGADILQKFIGKTYIERSFHKDGYHIILKGKSTTTNGKHEAGTEIYSDAHYFSITGDYIGNFIEITECQDELDWFINKYCPSKISPKQTEKRRAISNPSGGTLADKLGMRCEDIGYPTGATTIGHEIRGGHPFHGSTTGYNFSINTFKNVWICRSSNHRNTTKGVGGGPLELFAVREGIIECGDVEPGCLDTHWKEIFTALERCGYNIRPVLAASALRKIGVKI